MACFAKGLKLGRKKNRKDKLNKRKKGENN